MAKSRSRPSGTREREGRAQEGLAAALRIGTPAAKVAALLASAGDREWAKACGEALSMPLATAADDAPAFNLAEFASRPPG